MMPVVTPARLQEFTLELATAVVQEFRYRVSSTKNGNSFICSVRWSDKAGAKASDRPILFPSRIRQPIFAAGWL